VDDPAGRRALSEAITPLPTGAPTQADTPIPAGLDATLVLVRHGESTFIAEGRFQGQAETPLTTVGRRQAALVAGRLARPHESPALPVPAGDPVELIHSPLRRTAETADEMAEAQAAAGHPVPVRPDPGFLEIHQGEWQGLGRDEVEARYGPTLAAWRRTPLDAWAPGGESLRDVQQRVRPALAVALARLGEGRTPGRNDRSPVAGYHDPFPEHAWSIVVGHDGVFKVALLTLFDLPLDRFWMWSMDLCAITIVEVRAGRPVLRAHNLTAHLAAMADAAAVAELEERASGGAL
jgi:glucosyl-3-phosphoglycerate phosphatase